MQESPFFHIKRIFPLRISFDIIKSLERVVVCTTKSFIEYNGLSNNVEKRLSISKKIEGLS